MKIKQKDFYKTPDIIKALRITRMTLYRWERDGMVSFPRNKHGDRVVDYNELQKIIASLKR